MEHIVQFGISFDDEVIINRIKARAEDEIMRQLMLDAKKAIYQKATYSDTFTKQPSEYFDEKIDKFLTENKDAIIEMAADRLASRLARTKKAKELI